MRQVSLREFRTRGAKVLESVPRGETVLLSGQQGPAYFLVPVLGDLTLQDRELRRAIAKASLQESWRLAELRARTSWATRKSTGRLPRSALPATGEPGDEAGRP